MLIAQLTDTHITVPENKNRNCYVKLEALQKCVLKINQLDTPPDVVVHTGDLSHNGFQDEYTLIKSIMDDLKVPYFITAGNRDSVTNLTREFCLEGIQNKNQEFLQYSTDIMNYRLVSVDTSSKDSNLGSLNFSKLAHLDKILRQKPNNPTILFMHHPPIILSKSEPPKHEYEEYWMVKNFSEIVDLHPQIITFLCGHIHRSFSGNINFSPLLAMPPLSKSLYRGELNRSKVPEVSFCVHFFQKNNFAGTTVIDID